ncbi:MAG: HlyD family secretion protein [Bacteroidales bacterium]|nr:HlyD family secretion protein [Bacteroidales bacterium]
MRFSRRTILSVILVLLIVVMFLPIKVPYSFEATALVFPSREWYFNKGQDDSYVSELHDLKTNVIINLKGYKFERGDIAEVYIKEGLKSGDFITQSDTIAYIHSYFIENEIIRLENLKDVELASLDANTVGQKQEQIDEQEKEVAFAKQQLVLEEKNYNRQLKLFNDSVISLAEFEIFDNGYQLAEINVQIESSELLTLKTGRKPEEIKYIHQKINSYSREIETLNNLKQQYYIKSPISGVVNFNSTLNGILTVSDTNQFMLKIPVKMYNIQYLDRISAIRFSIPGYNDKIDASFIDLDENVNLMSNQQMVIAKALIEGKIQKVYPGMAVSCKVMCDEITIFEFLKRGIHLKF